MEVYKRFMLIGLMLLTVGAVGCTKNPVTQDKEISLFTDQEEIAMGAEAAPQFEQEFDGKVNNSKLQEYVSTVGNRLAAVSDRPMPYEFALLNSQVPNAFALPGGKIYVTAGLFKHMESERQLAAVLGHEVTHVAAKHNVKGLQRQLGASVLVELVGVIVGGESGSTTKAAAEIAAGMANLHYSRGDESQADAVGIRYMAQAGYNPWGMVEMLQVLDGLSQSQPGLFGDLFASHPLTSDRIKDVKEIVGRDYGGQLPAGDDPRAKTFLEMRELLVSVVK